jgi:RNA polymerase sigma-70 factor (TIGR02957 family)
MVSGSPDAGTFEAHRDLMFAVAYRMLGTVLDAEDAVQDAWLRWSATPGREVADPRAYLARVITNTSLNRLRSARARREAYAGPWLPEPLLTQVSPDSSERAELTESVSLAMLVVLESLTPQERAVFVLREVFAFGYAEIGAALGRSDVSVRQLAHRAREPVQARRPRFEVDRGQQREVTQRFLDAAVGGDIDRLMAVLAPEVILTSDGGGLARAARRPIAGADKVARFLAAISSRPYQSIDISAMKIEMAEINGGPGLLITFGSRVLMAATWLVAGGQVTAIQIVTNQPRQTAGNLSRPHAVPVRASVRAPGGCWPRRCKPRWMPTSQGSPRSGMRTAATCRCSTCTGCRQGTSCPSATAPRSPRAPARGPPGWPWSSSS